MTGFTPFSKGYVAGTSERKTIKGNVMNNMAKPANKHVDIREMSFEKALKELETKRNPFPHGVEALLTVHWVKPELVAEIKFTEWTHESAEGGMKLRAPVFLRLRDDKNPKECVLQQLLPEPITS